MGNGSAEDGTGAGAGERGERGGLLQTIEAIREKPELAKVKVRAHNQWIDRTLTENRITTSTGLEEEGFTRRRV